MLVLKSWSVFLMFLLSLPLSCGSMFVVSGKVAIYGSDKNPLSWKEYINCINVKEYLDFRMPLSRVLVAALAVQVPDRILRAQGQNLKLKMYCGKTCYTVQNAVHLVPVRQTWGTLRLIPV